MDDLAQRQLQRRRNRVPVPAAQYCPQDRLTAHRADGLHPYPSRQHAERRRQVHCHELGAISPPRGGERSAGTSRLGPKAAPMKQLRLTVELMTFIAPGARRPCCHEKGRPCGRPHLTLLLTHGAGSMHLPAASNVVHSTLLSRACCTSTAQSSGKPAGIVLVHFAPMAAAALPARR